MTRFTFVSVNPPALQPFIERLHSAIDENDLAAWQSMYDVLFHSPTGPPSVGRGGVLRLAPNFLECSEITRDSLPELGDELAAVLRRYVVASAPFCLRGSDELRGHFFDWYLGLVKEPLHVAERDLYDRLLWSPTEEIEEPFDFLWRERAESRGALLSPQQLGDLLATEKAGGLFGHVSAAIRAKSEAHARDLDLFVAFLALLVAGNLSGYYFEE